MVSDNVEPTPIPGHASSPKPRSFPRWVRRVVFGLGVLFLLLAGLHVYLGSASVADQVRHRLDRLLGTRVTVASARIGWISSSHATQLAIHETEPAPEGRPFLRIPHANLKLALAGVLTGRRPDGIDLEQPELYLRFAESGKLLTALPRPQPSKGATPPIRLRQATVTLDQIGRKPFTLSGLDGHLRSKDGGYHLTGTLTDPEWGVWQVEADFSSEEKLFLLRLKSPQTEVTQERLESLPFVSRSVWQSVELAGTTGADILVRVPIGGPRVTYRVDLDVQRVNLHVPVIELRAEGVQGRALVEDGIVQLQEVLGDCAGGKLTTTARLDFSAPPSQLQFTIRAEDVLIQRLPRSWKLPQALHGQVDMSADLLLKLEKPQLQAVGKGEGEVSRASFAGLPWPRKIPIKLVAEGARFRLDLPAIFFSRSSLAPR